MLGKDIFLDKYRKDLQDEARWLEYGAVFKADRVETLLRRHGIRPGTLLELGCGTGAVIRECQRRGLAKEYIAIDASEDAITWARDRSPGIECSVADITEPGFTLSKPVDVVVLSHVLEHLETPGDFLKGLVAQTPFTWLIAEVPLEDLLAARLKNLFRDRTKNSAGHVQFFTPKSFLKLLTSTGLQVEDTLRYVQPYGTEMLEWQVERLALPPAREFVMRMTQRHLPRLLAPLWSRFYYAHLAVLCRPPASGSRP
jgi:2-polyprenyl-3-methyl-5-hydroxy-6-metoxy-1,4-benzoquinol methylase